MSVWNVQQYHQYNIVSVLTKLDGLQQSQTTAVQCAAPCAGLCYFTISTIDTKNLQERQQRDDQAQAGLSDTGLSGSLGRIELHGSVFSPLGQVTHIFQEEQIPPDRSILDGTLTSQQFTTHRLSLQYCACRSPYEVQQRHSSAPPV